MSRKIVQIATMAGRIVALFDDGQVRVCNETERGWRWERDPIPQESGATQPTCTCSVEPRYCQLHGEKP